MKIAFVVGATGGVGSKLVDMLVASNHVVKATYRKDVQALDLKKRGATPVRLDLAQASQETLTKELDGCPNVFFTAGSGGKDVWNIDRDGAIKVANSLKDSSDSHLVLLSSLGTDPLDRLEKIEPSTKGYFHAKREADDAILAMAETSNLKTTIMRPGPLTNEDVANKIVVNRPFAISGRTLVDVESRKNSRATVAAVLMECAEVFANDRKARVFEMIEGSDDEPGEDIVTALKTLL